MPLSLLSDEQQCEYFLAGSFSEKIDSAAIKDQAIVCVEQCLFLSEEMKFDSFSNAFSSLLDTESAYSASARLDSADMYAFSTAASPIIPVSCPMSLITAGVRGFTGALSFGINSWRSDLGNCPFIASIKAQ